MKIFSLLRIMELRLALIHVICCLTVNTGWCMDEDTQSLVDRLERSTATNFTSTSFNVYHMETDGYRPGHILYTDLNALITSDGTKPTTIAGNTYESGYREGRGSEARFDYITGFTQITDKRIVVVDFNNYCLREINRLTGLTSAFSGHCDSAGYTDGPLGQFSRPWSVMRDNNDDDRLLVTDHNNRAVRTVEIINGAIATFVKSDILQWISLLTQDDKGDLYVIAARHALYRITYRQKIITLISGSPNNPGSRDSTLINSLFNYPQDLVFIGNQALLIADRDNEKIRLVDMITDKVSTLNLCSECLYRAFSILITNTSLYVGERSRIKQLIDPKLTTTSTTTSSTAIQPTYKNLTATKPTSIAPSTTTRAPCKERNVTLYVTSEEERAYMQITPAVQTRLAVGSHVIHKDNCSINIIVINNGTTTIPPCQDSNMTLYVKSEEERAFVELSPGEQSGYAVGNHVIKRDNCTIYVIVINNRTSTRPPCQDRNMTLYVTSAEERALVDTGPDQQTRFSVGSHIIYRDNCSITVIVKHNATKPESEKCPDVIRKVVSSSTGLSVVDLPLDGATQRLELPTGVYNYHIYGDTTNCSLKIEIKDYLLVRRIEMVAEYEIECALLTDNVAMSTLKSLADGNVNQIREFCRGDCSPQAGSQAKLSCESDTLTVTWSTDVTLNGTLTEIPRDLKQRLSDRLIEESRYPTLSLIVITKIPPLVYPTKTKTGAYAELVLTSSCLHNKKYDKITDSCV